MRLVQLGDPCPPSFTPRGIKPHVAVGLMPHLGWETLVDPHALDRLDQSQLIVQIVVDNS